MCGQLSEIEEQKKRADYIPETTEDSRPGKFWNGTPAKEFVKPTIPEDTTKHERAVKRRDKILDKESESEQKLFDDLINVDVLDEPIITYEEAPQIRWIRKHLIDDGVNCIIVGKTGSGKSFTGMELACIIQKGCPEKPNFTIDQICFNVRDFMDLVPKLPKKSVIILEEASVNADARRFWSDLNQAIVYITETFRASNLLFIANLPNFSGLDSRMRGLVRNLIITQRIDRPAKKCRVKWFKIEVDPVTGKMYKKYWRLNGRPIKIVKFGLPPKDLTDEYLRRKQQFRDTLHDTISTGFDARKEQDKQHGYFDVDKAVEEILAIKEQFLKTNTKGQWLDLALVQTHFGVGAARGTAVKIKAERKLGIGKQMKFLSGTTF